MIAAIYTQRASETRAKRAVLRHLLVDDPEPNVRQICEVMFRLHTFGSAAITWL